MIQDEDDVQTMDEIHKNSKILDTCEEDTNSYDSLESGNPNKKPKKYIQVQMTTLTRIHLIVVYLKNQLKKNVCQVIISEDQSVEL